MKRNHILIINGPNLDKLGSREVSVYGNETLEQINQQLIKEAKKFDFEIAFKQSNHEGKIIDFIHDSAEKSDAIIINAGGYSHTSVAIHDALKICKLPKVEVHLSNILNREEFRANSLISKACDGSIIGMGKLGYISALFTIKQMLTN
ncbi:MAG: type II 3-dehydroquinate dehydratase [Rickettsiales bacterium]